MNEKQQLISAFKKFLSEQKEVIDFYCVLINNKTGCINFIQDAWKELDYLSCSDQEYVYIHYSLHLDLITTKKGSLKRSPIEYHKSKMLGVTLELHNC